jgi:four helix bundle protein
MLVLRGEVVNQAEELRDRTKDFAVRVVKIVDKLPRRLSTEILAKQLVRSATSVGANYRAACRSRSHSEFVSKMQIVQEEADESQYWLELLFQVGVLKESEFRPLEKEASELTAIFTSSAATARGNKISSTR